MNIVKRTTILEYRYDHISFEYCVLVNFWQTYRNIIATIQYVHEVGYLHLKNIRAYSYDYIAK